MTIKVNERSFVIFDLDDTLYPELDYLASAYRHIAQLLQPQIGFNIYEEMMGYYQQSKNVFGLVIEKYGHQLPAVTTNDLLHEYRTHIPDIQLMNGITTLLAALKDHNIAIGLITDGRSISQRNKLKALGIEEVFSDIIISEEFGSEKPDPRNFHFFTTKYPGKEFIFFGDNTNKDFIIPASLGWTTICIKNVGRNVHKQDLDKLPISTHIVSTYEEIALVFA